MRKDPTLTQAEAKLAIIIWQEAPLTSPELVLLAEQKLHWKKSTTYTVLKRLCDKGVFKNDNAHISVLLTQEQQLARESRRYVEDSFGGSLPRFITSFMGGRKLEREHIEQLKRLIEAHEEESDG
jgi:predicted transcriptional regulator